MKWLALDNKQDHDLFLSKFTSALCCDSFNRLPLNSTLGHLPLSNNLSLICMLVICPGFNSVSPPVINFVTVNGRRAKIT
ncbi:protein CNPPD1 [Aphis craccivora]|uniref:Protein CNPPD1 n=1 Tax=Aphis craccivora TaxID=307492 RepID=A0A6G0YY41_APHCR|nr:protein CNPPD1 [Aphis craccivora]